MGNPPDSASASAGDREAFGRFPRRHGPEPAEQGAQAAPASPPRKTRVAPRCQDRRSCLGPATGTSSRQRSASAISAGIAQQVYLPTRNPDRSSDSSSSAEGRHGASITPLGRTDDQPLGLQPLGLQPSTPYRVRLVRTDQDLDAVVAVRREAYGSKLQALADQVGKPEGFDYHHGAVILLLEDRNTGKPLATTRLNTGHGLLPIMADMELPGFITSSPIGYVSRMAIVGEAISKPEIRILLDKAVFQLCQAKQIRNMLIFAVVPRQRIFMSRGFRDIFEDRQPRHPAFLNGVPIRALAMDVVTLEREWKALKHPMYSFIFDTFHPEIEVFSVVTSVRWRGRRDAPRDGQVSSDDAIDNLIPTLSALTESARHRPSVSGLGPIV